MTIPSQDPAQMPVVLAAGDVVMPARFCSAIFHAMQQQLAGQRTNGGGRVRAEGQAALEAFRLGMLRHLDAQRMSAAADMRADIARQIADIEPPSLLGTASAAIRLGVSARHLRRIAAEHGIHPIARNAWAATDVADLEAHRRSTR